MDRRQTNIENMYIHIYIYICKERNADKITNRYQYIYIYIYIKDIKRRWDNKLENVQW